MHAALLKDCSARLRIALDSPQAGAYAGGVLKQIVIRNRTYTLRADDNDDIELVAADVDRRMRELASKSAAFDDYTIALLTAMNLASELRAVRQRVHQRLDELDRKSAALEALLEAASNSNEPRAEEPPHEP